MLPSISKSSRCQNDAFVRGFCQIPRFEIRKRSFRAMLPSNSKNWRCENEALVRGFLQISKVEDVTTCLRRSSSNGESVSRHAKHNSTASSTKRENHVEPSVPLRAQSELEPTTPKTVAHASLYYSTHPKLRLPEKNTRFRANPNIHPNIQMTSMIYKHDAFWFGDNVQQMPTGHNDLLSCV